MKTIKYLFAALFILSVTTLFAQKDKSNLINEPGYYDFGDLSYLQSGPDETEVLLDEPILKSISKMSNNEDPELEKALGNIKLIRVSGYGVTEKNLKDVNSKIEETSKNLLSKNWDRIVSKVDKKGQIAVFLKNDSQNEICGLVVIVKRNNQTVNFVNIVGKLDVAALGKLGGKFNIPSLNKVKETIGDDKPEKEKKDKN